MTIKILTVDDEPDVRRLIEIKLKKAGFEVITAADGEEGVEKAKAENPDLVLMDVMMPKMDGYTAVEKIKTEMDPAPLVMMLTAKGTEDDVMQGLVGGADDYITKPFAPRELVARVTVALIKAGRKADLPE
jgi:two-component system alkaline phosphatase synthesis response regulator PhoP